MFEDLEYVGFWPRLGASVIDSMLLLVVLIPIMLIFGDSHNSFALPPAADALVSYILPAVAVIWFWSAKRATPGKMAIKAQIVDAKTGEAPTTMQLVIRYVGYFISALPLCLGYIWIVFDDRRQGWHDKMAGTVVVRPVRHGPVAVSFQRTEKAEPR